MITGTGLNVFSNLFLLILRWHYLLWVRNKTWLSWMLYTSRTSSFSASVSTLCSGVKRCIVMLISNSVIWHKISLASFPYSSSRASLFSPSSSQCSRSPTGPTGPSWACSSARSSAYSQLSKTNYSWPRSLSPSSSSSLSCSNFRAELLGVLRAFDSKNNFVSRFGGFSEAVVEECWILVGLVISVWICIDLGFLSSNQIIFARVIIFSHESDIRLFERERELDERLEI